MNLENCPACAQVKSKGQSIRLHIQMNLLDCREMLGYTELGIRSYRVVIYCARCKEYKGVVTCSLCKALYCIFCESPIEENNMLCDHRNTIVEQILV